MRAAALILLLVALSACSGADADPTPVATATTPDPAQAQAIGEVAGAFAVYRAGIEQGEGEAVVGVVTDASLEAQEAIVELARTGDEAAIRTLPAVDQLLVLTYRLRPQLLEEPDPFLALVDAGLAGQDRTLGELGDVELVGEDDAVATVLDPMNLAPTALRWRFAREAGEWRFDLADANRLVSSSIAAAAQRSGQGVDEIVTATIVDLSREPIATVEALYAEPPA